MTVKGEIYIRGRYTEWKIVTNENRVCISGEGGFKAVVSLSQRRLFASVKSMASVEYSNEEICKMNEDDFAYLKSKLYNTINIQKRICEEMESKYE